MTPEEVNLEEWLPVVGYEGIYEVSSFGRVRSLERLEFVREGFIRRRAAKLLNERFDLTSTGYSHVNLSKAGRSKKVNVHVLVLEAFVSLRPSRDHEACHNNGNRADARLENLRWDTVSGNAADKELHGTVARGERSGNVLLTEEDVHFIRKSPLSSLKLAPLYGVASSTIRAVRLGQNWSWLGRHQGRSHAN